MADYPTPTMKAQPLTDMEFDETGKSVIQVFPYGEYSHPRYGEITMNQSLAQRLAKNFSERVVPADIPINYNHERGGEAAGWYQSVIPKEDGLYAEVAWTQTAIEKIKDGRYRYFSAEIDDKWENPKTKQRHADVLRGGALTNVPFFKDISKIRLSEEEGIMAFKDDLIAALELSEGAGEEEILKTVKAVKETPSEAPAQPEREFDDQTKSKLEEAGLSKVFTMIEARDNRIAQLELADRMRDAATFVDKWSKAEFSLPASVGEQMQDLLLSLPGEGRERVVKLFDELTTVGMVSSERGSVTPHIEKPSATKQFTDKVSEIMDKADGLSYKEAVVKAQQQYTDLYKQYKQETYNWTGVPSGMEV